MPNISRCRASMIWNLNLVRVRVCVRARVCVCVCVCLVFYVCACVCVHVRALSHICRHEMKRQADVYQKKKVLLKGLMNE
jgi:hypothetical protein